MDAVVDHTLIREEEFLFLVVVFDPHSIMERSILFSAYGNVVHSSEADEGLKDRRHVIGVSRTGQ